mmetsp:Transcript_31034/g.104482  ORF Transcript_31034/g.104482 Transcript_31034/m.104482 type:complete len:291 (+) Transcript_31034:1611-2483(+)
MTLATKQTAGSETWSPQARPIAAARAPMAVSSLHTRTTLPSMDASCRFRRSCRSDGARGPALVPSATTRRSSVRRTCAAAVESEAASARRMPAPVEKMRRQCGAALPNCWPSTVASAVSSCPQTPKTIAPAFFRATTAFKVGNVCPECVTARTTAPRTASAAVMPLGKTVRPVVAAPHVESLAHAVRLARTLFADATTTLKFGQACLRFVTHCSASQSEASTPMTTRSTLALASAGDASARAKSRAAAELSDARSRKRSRIAAKTRGVAARSSPMTSQCLGGAGMRGMMR